MVHAGGAIFLALAAVCTVAFPLQPRDPVIGIVTHPLNQCFVSPPPNVTTNACVESYYVRWLEAVGIRVVAVPHNATFERQEWFLNRVNGVLFQGGGLEGIQEEYYLAMASKIYNYAIERNAKGDPFVVWGTCQGFQVISAWAAGTLDVLKGPYDGMYPSMMSLNFTQHMQSSRMYAFGRVPERIMDYLVNSNTTLNWHHFIVEPSAWERYPSMQRLLTILSTNIVPNTNGIEFVSSVESPIAEIYAVQFHPERPPYTWENDRVGHTAEDMAVSSYFANFIASRLRLNNHTFDTPQQYEEHRIGQWPLLDSGWGMRTYFVWNRNM